MSVASNFTDSFQAEFINLPLRVSFDFRALLTYLESYLHLNHENELQYYGTTQLKHLRHNYLFSRWQKSYLLV